MARSMTAFARLEASTAGGRAVWELRSVNHRFLEVSLRLPEEFRGLDHEIRNRLSARLNRGKLDCTLRFEAAARDQSALKVNTELDRLETHLQEVVRVMGQDQPIGRRLDFLMQELNREANTLGSKSAHIDTSSASVELKVLIEQIREQIQNLE
jgi:uncharacterized protein YicC (UPF0701 family)